MQGMEADTATPWIIDGICQQVVYIYQQATQQQPKGLQPFFGIDNTRESQRGQDVQGYMNQLNG